MLSQLLERDFLLKSIAKLNDAIREGDERLAKNDPDIVRLLNNAGVGIEDLRTAGLEFQGALQREIDRGPTDLEERVFLPRDAILSLAQSALQQFCEEKRPANLVQNSARRLSPSRLIPVTDTEMDHALASFLGGPSPARGLWGRYELIDIGWVSCLAAIGIRAWRKRHPFNDQPAQLFRIGNRARVIMIGDWGSGLPRARKISDVIRSELDAGEAKSRDKHVVHLGDVYYTGLAREYENNFLAHWPVKASEAETISSWALNANHDMYSGGWGYFDYLLRDEPRFKGHRDANGKPSSFFTLENDHWIILGLDTGYHDNLIFDAHELYGRQADWVKETLARVPGKNAMLLSHHQPFSLSPLQGTTSARETINKELIDKLAPPLQAERVRAWFWGHEHRCVLYDPRFKIEYPRCIGHGGVPFYVATTEPPDGVSYEYREGFRDLLESWNYFGLVTLDFEEKNIQVRYLNERGLKHHEERLVGK